MYIAPFTARSIFIIFIIARLSMTQGYMPSPLSSKAHPLFVPEILKVMIKALEVTLLPRIVSMNAQPQGASWPSLDARGPRPLGQGLRLAPYRTNSGTTAPSI
jgi:hypothetical protein